MKRALLSLGLAALVAMPSLATAAEWKIDSAHTSVNFKIRHIFTKVDGSFGEVDGTIHFDPENPEQASAEITIPASSIDTNNEKRDQHLQSDDFFDAANHPNLTFKSTGARQTDDGLKVDGELTMNGITNPVTLDVEFLGAGPGMGGGQVAGFEVTTTIDRKEWDIIWNQALDHGGALLGDEVEISIQVEATSAA